MVELNTVNSVLQVCQSSILQRAWTRHQQVQVHGWVYSIGTGEIKDLQVNAACNTDVEKILSII